VSRLCCLGVLKRINESEWGAPSFGIPKKNGKIRFVSDFRQLNKVLRRTPYPLPVPQEIFRTMDGFSFCTTMDINMGFWAIPLSSYSQQLCTIVLPWGKYCYLRLPMGLAVRPDIYQENMSVIFADMTEVIVYIDDICVITKGDFTTHLRILGDVLRRLETNQLKVHAEKSKLCCFETEFLGFVLSHEGI
jgi:Reverse transcriptase (RNA-dependent DNA polymerase)